MVPLITKNYIKNNEILTQNQVFLVQVKFRKKFKHKNLYSSTYAYNIKNHRHICEIDQEFKKKLKKK